MDMARVEIPVSGWTCLRTESSQHDSIEIEQRRLTLVDVGRVGLLAGLAALLLLASGSSGSLLAGFLLLSGGLSTSRGLATGGGLLLSSFGRHDDVD